MLQWIQRSHDREVKTVDNDPYAYHESISLETPGLQRRGKRDATHQYITQFTIVVVHVRRYLSA
jgi:hypothetical protein